MSAFQSLIDAMNSFSEVFSENSNWPDPNKNSWEGRQQEILALADRVSRECLASFASAMIALDEELKAEESRSPQEHQEILTNITEQMQAGIVDCVQNVAAALVCAGEEHRAKKLLRECSDRIAQGAVRDEMRAAEDHLQAFANVVSAQFYLSRFAYGKADANFAKALKISKAADEARAPSTSSGSPATISARQESYSPFVEAAKKAPRPLEKAPTMYTLNGIGTHLYGKRDRRDDGTYIATLWFCILFVPIFPIRAYRVRDEGGGQFSFFAVEPLSGFARGMRAAALAATLIFTGVGAVSSYLSSDSVTLTKDIKAAEALEKEGKLAEAEAKYCQMLRSSRDFSDRREEIGTTSWRIFSRDLASPLRDEHISDALHVLHKCNGATNLDMLFSQTSTTAAQWLVDLEDSISTLDENLPLADLENRLRLFKGIKARKMLTGKITPSMRAAKLSLLLRQSKQWPLSALPRLLKHKSEEAKERVKSILAELPSDVDTWSGLPLQMLQTLQNGDETFEAFSDKANAAMALQVERAKLNVEQKEKSKAALKKWLRKHPKDPVAATWLAQIYEDDDKSKQALNALESFEQIKWLPLGTIETKGRLLFAMDQLEDAEPLLSRAFALKKGAYLAASRGLVSYGDALEKRLVSQAQNGSLPSQLSTELNSLSEKAAQKRFGEWLQESFETDVGLKKRRVAFEKVAPTANLAMQLGMVELFLASSSSGKQKQKRLQLAEQSFEMLTSYGSGLETNIKLGEVKIRLGKEKEGEKLLDDVSKNGSAAQMLSVANTYRNLGRDDKAIRTATAVYEGGRADQAKKFEAAVQMALLASDTGERELWLKRSDPKNDFVRISLLEVQAERQIEALETKAAIETLGKVAAHYEKTAAINNASANNGGLAYFRRYEISFDKKDADRGVALLRKSVKLSPQSPLPRKNTFSAVRTADTIRFLTPLVNLKEVQLRDSERSSLRNALAVKTGNAKYVRDWKKQNSKMELLNHARTYLMLSPSSPDAYWSLSSLLTGPENVSALERLASQAQLRKLNLESTQKAFEKSLTQDAVEKKNKATLDRIQTLKDTVAWQKSAHEKASLHFILGDQMASLGLRMLDDNMLKDAQEHYGKAKKLWPDLQMADELARVSLKRAIAQAHSEKAFSEDRLHDLKTLPLHEWIFVLHQENPARLEQLQAQPAFQKMWKILQKEKGSMLKLVIAKSENTSISDKEIQEVTTPQWHAREKLSLVLAPYLPAHAHDKAMWSWLRAQ
ncbi:MAG: tetratricopeptide repeat protein [Deltaproteobacteria bacterium]|nr:tetratricopeptide repeat protein [Deltaproteobacteria bacterium]